MMLVIVESPYAGDIEANVKYARECMRVCLLQDMAPYASHLLYTQDGVLKDHIREDRVLGIEAGFAWGKKANERHIFMDRGMSSGMNEGLRQAYIHQQEVLFRWIYEPDGVTRAPIPGYWVRVPTLQLEGMILSRSWPSHPRASKPESTDDAPTP